MLRIARAGKLSRLPRPLAFSGKDELNSRSTYGAKSLLPWYATAKPSASSAGTSSGRVLGPDEQIEVNRVPR